MASAIMDPASPLAYYFRGELVFLHVSLRSGHLGFAYTSTVYTLTPSRRERSIRA